MLLASTRTKRVTPRRGMSPASDAPRQHTDKTGHATTGHVPVERCSSPAHGQDGSRHDGACPRRAMLLASTRTKRVTPRRGMSPSSGAPRQHMDKTVHATTGHVPVERCSSPAHGQNGSRHDGACPRRAMLLASTRTKRVTPRRGMSPASDAPRQHMDKTVHATTGHVPVERCSSPAHGQDGSRHDGACPRRAMLLASTRTKRFTPRRGMSPSSDAPRQHMDKTVHATTGHVPVERCSSPGKQRSLARSSAPLGLAGLDQRWREWAPQARRADGIRTCVGPSSGLCPFWKGNRGLTATARIVLALRATDAVPSPSPSPSPSLLSLPFSSGIPSELPPPINCPSSWSAETPQSEPGGPPYDQGRCFLARSGGVAQLVARNNHAEHAVFTHAGRPLRAPGHAAPRRLRLVGLRLRASSRCRRWRSRRR